MTGTLVCATRGGEGSRVAQLTAIEMAKSKDQHLIFLYVVDSQRVAEQKEVLQEAMHAEFHWLANALLNIARQRAERAGLSAEVIVREGIVKDEIEQFLRDNEASMLLLGAPRGTSPQFGDEAIERFAHAIEEDTGVPVTVVRPEDHESLLDRNRY